MNQKQLLFLFFFFPLVTVYGQSKTFVRDYTYRASDSDSKISSRQKALKEVKAFLIEELGTYVESYVNYEVEELNGKMTKDFFTNEIKTFSAGHVETKIIEEEWDGYDYYIRAEITADPEEVVRRINETLSVRKKSLVIDSLKSLLQYSEVELNNRVDELDELQSKLERTNGQLNLQKSNYEETRKELEALKTQLADYQRQEVEIKSEIEALREKVLSRGSKARKFVRIGMTSTEVVNYLGEESSYGGKTLNERAKISLRYQTFEGNQLRSSTNTHFFAIGDIWFHYSEESGLVDGVWEHDKMMLIKDASTQSDREYLMKKYNIGKKLY